MVSEASLSPQSCCMFYSRPMQVIFGAHVIQYKAALALSDSQDYMHVLCAIRGLFAHGDNNKINIYAQKYIHVQITIE